MADEGKRRMAFYEICGGKFAHEVQQEFEDAQAELLARGGRVQISVNIFLVAPPPGDPNFGGIKYSVSTKYPKIESREFTTEFRDGCIVSDGESVAELLQERLQFPDLAPKAPKTATK